MAAPYPGAVVPLPVGSRIIHIGPPKTGTTALQASCWAARAALLKQGVRYAGGQQHLAIAARAVTGYETVIGHRKAVPSIRWWTSLVREMDGATESRVLYSSEALADADDDAIRRIATDIGADRVQVLVTLRPIDAVLASQWQNSVQTGSVQPLDRWLRGMLVDPGSPDRNPRAHRAIRQGELVSRWASVVGPDRVTVLALDRRDPAFLFRTTESLLGLREGTLQRVDDHDNRSLSLPEVEVIRQINIQGRAAGMGEVARSSFVTMGAAVAAKRRPPFEDAPRVRLPAWAMAHAVAWGQSTVATLASSGVRVIGDLDVLVPDVAGLPADAVAPAAVDDDGAVFVDAETAAAIALGIAWGTGLRLGADQPVPPRDLPLTFVSTRQLARQIVRRATTWLRRSRKLAGLGGD